MLFDNTNTSYIPVTPLYVDQQQDIFYGYQTVWSPTAPCGALDNLCRV